MVHKLWSIRAKVGNYFDQSLNVPSHDPWEIIMICCLVRQLNTSTSQLFEKVLPFDPQTGS